MLIFAEASTEASIAAETWLGFSAGLIGAFVGALASILTTILALRHERKNRQEEWERERQSRFHHQRREIYAAFAGAGAQVVNRVEALQRYPNEAATHISELLRGISKLGDAYERITFIANSEVALAAEMVRRSLEVADWMSPPSDFRAKYLEAIAAFNAAGRKELGLDYDLPELVQRWQENQTPPGSEEPTPPPSER